MKPFSMFSDDVNPQLSGNKFYNLSQMSELFKIPKAICINTQVFEEAIGPEGLEEIKRFYVDVRATVGSFLLSSMPTLDSITSNIFMNSIRKEELKKKLEEEFGSLRDRKFAVRSSSASEDSSLNSFAGVYKSILNVSGFDALCVAIHDCWKQYFSYSAVIARIRAGVTNSSPDLAIIIQEMVDAKFAGVAFTQENGDVLIEYVDGLGEALVSGETPAQQIIFNELTTKSEPFDKVYELARSIRAIQSYEVDLEWALDPDNQVHLLQVRPITALIDSQRETNPIWLAASLYLEKYLPSGMDLGECSEVYLSYVSKRSDSYLLAKELDVMTGPGFILSFNGKGFSTKEDRFKEMLLQGPSQKVVLDINSNVRQIIIDKSKLFSFIVETFMLTPESTNICTFIMRDFIQGEYGFISKRYGENGVIIEYSSEGLLNINRGIAHCRQIIISDLNQSISTESFVDEFQVWFQNSIEKIAAFTMELDKKYAGCQLEWVLSNGEPYYVDFSRENHDLVVNSEYNSLIVSTGSARGPVLNILEDEMLNRLSIGPAVSVDKYSDLTYHEELQQLTNKIKGMDQKPIVIANKPYAIFSIILDDVAGFIFHEGSLLCHLAILLREQKIPSIIKQNVIFVDHDDIFLSNGNLVMMETQ